MTLKRPIVLIFDDNVRLCEDLSEILDDAGYETAVAFDGEQGLRLLRRAGQPCLILLDLIMPVMDGFAVMKALQTDRTFPDNRVVLMTAGMTDSGMFDGVPLLQKPVDLPTLLRIVGENAVRPSA